MRAERAVHARWITKRNFKHSIHLPQFSNFNVKPKVLMLEDMCRSQRNWSNHESVHSLGWTFYDNLKITGVHFAAVLTVCNKDHGTVRVKLGASLTAEFLPTHPQPASKVPVTVSALCAHVLSYYHYASCLAFCQTHLVEQKEHTITHRAKSQLCLTKA